MIESISCDDGLQIDLGFGLTRSCYGTLCIFNKTKPSNYPGGWHGHQVSRGVPYIFKVSILHRNSGTCWGSVHFLQKKLLIRPYRNINSLLNHLTISAFHYQEFLKNQLCCNPQIKSECEIIVISLVLLLFKLFIFFSRQGIFSHQIFKHRPSFCLNLPRQGTVTRHFRHAISTYRLAYFD